MTDDVLLMMLIRTAISGESPNSKIESECTPEMMYALYELANKHDLAHLVAYALEKCNIPQCEVLSKFDRIKTQAIYRYLRLDHGYEQIHDALETAKVPFIPLKGTVLRAYYPEPWMRTSCDVDILVKEVDLERAVDSLTKQGWEVQGKRNYHDILLVSDGGVHLELHFHIKQNFAAIDGELGNAWEYSQKVDGSQFEYRLDNAYFLFHLLAHMVYHFLRGGCGIRPLLDIWILRAQMDYDEALVNTLCRNSHIDKFYENALALINVWFENGEHTSDTRYMEKVILEGGVYGDFFSRVILDQANAGSRIKHVIRRIFMPYSKLKTKYPILERYRWLTPVFQVVRWCRVLVRGRARHSLMEMRKNQETTYAQLQEAEEFLKKTGLHNIEYHRDD